MEEAKNNPFAPYELQISVADRKKIIAPLLVELRRAHHLSQRKVAMMVGVLPQTFNGWEKGRNEPPIEYLVRLSYLYGVSLDTLCGRNVFVIPTKENVASEADKMREQIAALQAALDADDCTKEQREQLQPILDTLRMMVRTVQDANAARPEEPNE